MQVLLYWRTVCCVFDRKLLIFVCMRVANCSQLWLPYIVKLFALLFKASFFMPEGVRIQSSRDYEFFHWQCKNQIVWLKDVTDWTLNYSSEVFMVSSKTQQDLTPTLAPPLSGVIVGNKALEKNNVFWECGMYFISSIALSRNSLRASLPVVLLIYFIHISCVNFQSTGLD